MERLPAIYVGVDLYLVIGILRDVVRKPELLGSVIIPEGTARRYFNLFGPGLVVVETKVGAASLIALQARPAAIHMATHVLTPANDRSHAAIAFSIRPDGTPDLLTTADVAMLDVSGSVAVLSGCHTMGGEIRSGAGMIGLTRAWLVAGARGVVATAWPVTDHSGDFFGHFYRHLAAGTMVVHDRAPISIQALSARRTANLSIQGQKLVSLEGFPIERLTNDDLALIEDFLLPENLNRLAPKFLDLRPGTRIVANHFGVDGWNADETGRANGDCGSWCTALLYIVPAKVAGTWRSAQGDLRLEQSFQMVSGTLVSRGIATPIANGRLRGDQISFSVAGTQYSGRVEGDRMGGRAGGSAWNATRVQP